MMDIVIMPKCQAILKSGVRAGTPCGNAAKYGDFCGVHRPKQKAKPKAKPKTKQLKPWSDLDLSDLITASLRYTTKPYMKVGEAVRSYIGSLLNPVFRKVLDAAGTQRTVESIKKAIKEIIGGELGTHSIGKRPIPDTDYLRYAMEPATGSVVTLFLTMVDYLVNEVVELAVEEADGKEITIDDVDDAISKDEELRKLLA